MASSITAEQAAKRIQDHFGDAWKTTGGDGFKAGKPTTEITGITTTWSPTIEVLRQAVANKQNLIVSVLSPFWAQPTAGGRGARGNGGAATVPVSDVQSTELYKYKSDYIEEHNLVIWRFSENWDALPEQYSLHALANSLGWKGHEDAEATKSVAPVGAAVYAIPQAPLTGVANAIKAKNGVRTMRVVGDPNAMISRVVLRPGYLLVPAAMQMVRDTKADAVVCGEACEWEAFEYCEDWISAGWGKAMLMLGYAVSEGPGTKEMATWIKSFVTEVPVSDIQSGEPFQPVKA
jgi:putative NIF3 family GTP cyclohydrolase 1 type 2